MPSSTSVAEQKNLGAAPASSPSPPKTKLRQATLGSERTEDELLVRTLHLCRYMLKRMRATVDRARGTKLNAPSEYTVMKNHVVDSRVDDVLGAEQLRKEAAQARIGGNHRAAKTLDEEAEAAEGALAASAEEDQKAIDSSTLAEKLDSMDEKPPEPLGDMPGYTPAGTGKL